MSVCTSFSYAAQYSLRLDICSLFKNYGKKVHKVWYVYNMEYCPSFNSKLRLTPNPNSNPKKNSENTLFYFIMI